MNVPTRSTLSMRLLDVRAPAEYLFCQHGVGTCALPQRCNEGHGPRIRDCGAASIEGADSHYLFVDLGASLVSNWSVDLPGAGLLGLGYG